MMPKRIIVNRNYVMMDNGEPYVKDDIDKQTTKYVSLGAGLQSSIMAIMIANKDERLKEYWGANAIFSDTGGEQDHTYEYLKNFLIDYLEERGMRVYWIMREDGLIDHFQKRKQVPMGFAHPLCSSWSKKENIYTMYRTLHGRYNKSGKLFLHGAWVKITEMIGITTDEIERVNTNGKYKWLNRVYPLVDLKLSREDLYKIYEEYNVPAPKKSGCWFCPGMGKKIYIDLFKNDRERFNILLNMEIEAGKENPKNPPTFLHKFPLKDIVTNNKNVDSYTDVLCGSSCMT